jgi:hypothetical protein
MDAGAEVKVGTGGTGAVTVARRTVGRGTQVITVTGGEWREVQREAAKVWHAADTWLRQQVPPFAQPVAGGGFEAKVFIGDAE